MKSIIFIVLVLIISLNNLYAKGSSPPKSTGQSSCQKEGFLNADSDDKEREFRSILLPPASEYGGDLNSGQVETGGKIACRVGHLCYLNQNYPYRLSTSWDKNRGCSKDACNTEIGKTLGIKYPAGEYLAQFQISHGAFKDHNLGRVKAFELVKSSDGKNCLKQISSRDIISTGRIHENNHTTEKPFGLRYQHILLPFSTNGTNPIILKTYWRRNEERFLCKTFNDCTWLWQGSISVNPIGSFGRPNTYKRPIWIYAHRRNNIVRMDAALMTTAEFNYAYNPKNGVIARLTEDAFNYYSANKELKASNGEGANCVEFDVTPTGADTNALQKIDPKYSPSNPKHKWMLWHPKLLLESKVIDVAPGDFEIPAKTNFLGVDGGGIYNIEGLNAVRGWGTLPSGSEAYFKRLREWLRGEVKIGDYPIKRRLACAMIDLKKMTWPDNQESYKGKYEQYTKDLFYYLKTQMGWEDDLFKRTALSIPIDTDAKAIIKTADALFSGGFPGIKEVYSFSMKKSGGDPVKNRIDYYNTLKENGVDFMSVAVGLLQTEWLPQNIPNVPVDPIYLYYQFLAEIKNQKDRNNFPHQLIFYTIDQSINFPDILDHGVDAMISNWPSRLRIILDQYPYKYYLRRATADDPLRKPKNN